MNDKIRIRLKANDYRRLDQSVREIVDTIGVPVEESPVQSAADPGRALYG